MSNHTPTAESNRKLGDMNHPTPEAWMAYLYREMPPADHAGLSEHLAACPECLEKVKTWRRTLGALDDWSLPKKKATVRLVQPIIKWGLAAMILLGMGLGLGHYAIPAEPGIKSLQKVLEPSLRAALEKGLRQSIEEALLQDWQAAKRQWLGELQQHNQAQITQMSADLAASISADTQQLLARFALAYEQARQKDHESVLTTLRQWEAQRAVDYAHMRADLETLAVVTESELERSQRQIGTLASFTQTISDKSGLPDDSTQRQPDLNPNSNERSR